MPARLSRPATAAALALALGLVGLPACKKKARVTDPDAPNNAPGDAPNPFAPFLGPAGKAEPAGPPPDPVANAGRDPLAPRSPVFGRPTEDVVKEAKGNLRKILHAHHAFEQANRGLPAGYADATGRPGLSWRVAVLPYLGLSDLHQQFKLNEPWDSEHNKKLIDQMPPVYAPPGVRTNGYTFYRGFAGPNTWFPPSKQPAQPGQALLGMKLINIAATDGVANTFLVVEARDPVTWTRPDELAYHPTTPPPLGGVFSTGFYAGMADTSVRFIGRGVNPKAVVQAIDPGDGAIPEPLN